MKTQREKGETKPPHVATPTELLILSLVASQHPDLAPQIARTSKYVHPDHVKSAQATNLVNNMLDRFYLGKESVEAIAHGITYKNLTWGYVCTLIDALNTQIQAFNCYNPKDHPYENRQAWLKTLLLLRLLIVPMNQQRFSWADMSGYEPSVNRCFNDDSFKIVTSMKNSEIEHLYLKCVNVARPFYAKKLYLSSWSNALFGRAKNDTIDTDAHEYSNDASDDDSDNSSVDLHRRSI